MHEAMFLGEMLWMFFEGRALEGLKGVFRTVQGEVMGKAP